MKGPVRRPLANRNVKRLVAAKPTIEGAGVRLRRAFGFGDPAEHDPFLLCGSYRGTRGPVEDIAARPVYLDISVPAGKRASLPVETTSHAFARGDAVEVDAGEEGVRFLLVSGQPLGEPVAWYGPVVMNTQEELRHAFEQLDEGTFLRPDARR